MDCRVKPGNDENTDKPGSDENTEALSRHVVSELCLPPRHSGFAPEKEGAERREAHPIMSALTRGCALPLREARPPFGAHAGGTRHRLSPRWLSPRTGFPQDAAFGCFARSPHNALS